MKIKHSIKYHSSRYYKNQEIAAFHLSELKCSNYFNNINKKELNMDKKYSNYLCRNANNSNDNFKIFHQGLIRSYILKAVFYAIIACIILIFILNFLQNYRR
jgi:hypothetical protein